MAKAMCREGGDGPWGTFHLRVGTPPQIVRVLPSTSSPETLVVDPRGCGEAFGFSFNCSLNSRGGEFNSSQSSTWRPYGLYNLNLNTYLNYSGNGEYGTDTVGLDLSTGQTTMQNQTVCLYYTLVHHVPKHNSRTTCNYSSDNSLCPT
jgi:hypothetical protein